MNPSIHHVIHVWHRLVLPSKEEKKNQQSCKGHIISYSKTITREKDKQKSKSKSINNCSLLVIILLHHSSSITTNKPTTVDGAARAGTPHQLLHLLHKLHHQHRPHHPLPLAHTKNSTTKMLHSITLPSFSQQNYHFQSQTLHQQHYHLQPQTRKPKRRQRCILRRHLSYIRSLPRRQHHASTSQLHSRRFLPRTW